MTPHRPLTRALDAREPCSDIAPMSVTVSTFYKFVTIEDTAALRSAVAAFGCARGIKGTVLIAREGINATLSGTESSIAQMLAWLRTDSRFAGLESKDSSSPTQPFRRFKVKVKSEIVTFGHPEVNPAVDAGTYVTPQDWNALIQQPGVVVVDTRNAYEVGIGTFPGALDPGTRTFSEFPEFAEGTLGSLRDRKIAMFCTGGIRCEKATAYLRANGFDEVYHLQGGILKYLEVVPQKDSLWQGECFIFDERVALDHDIKPGQHRSCSRCGLPYRGARDEGGSTAQCSNCAAG